MDKTYQPREIESAWYHYWKEHGFFSPSNHPDSEPYCIMLPPPNVTGSLHMGHAFQQTLMDILVRYHRMKGHNTLWQGGTDHAGIATQMVVERQLEAQGKSRHTLGREDFIASVWDWKRHSGDTITRQSQRLGISMDWERERFTLDEGLSRAVKEVFVRLYDQGLIYRGKRLVNWDPVLHTALSDLEVISQQEDGWLWYMRYPRCDGQGHIIVATTRPETMLGDMAVAVHPQDERYLDLIGKTLVLPLCNRNIPVIADEYVDPAFGSGCVKITPAHDFNDYKIGQRHDLPVCNIFTADACLNECVPQPYQGLDRYAARKQIIADLDDNGYLEKTEAYKLMIPRGDRSNAVIEPYLTDQWYIKVESLAEPAIRAVEQGDVKFVPDHWAKTYFEWMRNIEDWCISRQLWWGHRIPAWYDDDGNLYVAHDEAAVREKYQLADTLRLRQDEDVLDTWFSSSLWPFSTLGWPEETAEMKRFYPSDVLVTGFDIIFFWVARMIMMGLKFTGEVPFREVYIHGLVRDNEGQKMSKSKGNILDPIDLIDGIDRDALLEKRTKGLIQPQQASRIKKLTHQHFPKGIAAYGTDSLRFTFASLATQGRDIRFDVGRIAGYRNFCNKLWNAARYILMHVQGQAMDIGDGEKKLNQIDKWINGQLSGTIVKVEADFRRYRFDLASQAIYEFTWNTYCDWYLEFSKVVLKDQTIALAYRRGTLFTLVQVLEAVLRLMHPVMPFITEELWQKMAPLLGIDAETIMLQAYPSSRDFPVDQAAMMELEWVKTLIMGLRKIRSERDIAPGRLLMANTAGGSEAEQLWLSRNMQSILALARLGSITPVSQQGDDSIAVLAGSMTVSIPLRDLIDPAVELERLQKDIDRLNLDKAQVQARLANKQFIDRAPQHIVQKQQANLQETNAALDRLAIQFEQIKSLLH